MRDVLLVALGGGLGSALRYGVALALPTRELPWGTLTVNVLGSLLLGFVVAVALSQKELSTFWTPLVAIGFCGGFTTFSSFALQQFQQLQVGNYIPFVLYAGLSLIGGLLAVGLGWWLGSQLT